jgi:hypothetical protein
MKGSKMKKEMTREELVKAVEDAKTAWRDSDLVADAAAYDAYYDARNALRAYDKTQMKQYFDYLEILRKSGVTNNCRFEEIADRGEY